VGISFEEPDLDGCRVNIDQKTRIELGKKSVSWYTCGSARSTLQIPPPFYPAITAQRQSRISFELYRRVHEKVSLLMNG
jgi:hypothetical protein